LLCDFEYATLPKILEVDSINSDDVYQLLSKMSPELMVVWGGKIMDARIIATAKKTINLHIGRCPMYRGVLANQHAVLDGDFENIGATIHYVVPEVDSGDVIEIVEPDLSKQPRDLFADLCDRAQAVCLDIAGRLHKGEDIPGYIPVVERKGIMLLKHWTPQVRYKVAKRMYSWENRGIKLHSKKA
jgi:methionyl-tRNA formyltransferase